MKGIHDTSSMTYRQVMGNGLLYEIPKFQRDYSWDVEQWDDLWFDIQQLKEEQEHYLGYLVLQSKSNKEYVVIDGQQRLTTMSLMILAVIKSIDELPASLDQENNKVRSNLIRNTYIGALNPETLITNNKLKLNKNSDSYYCNYLVLLKELPVRSSNASQKQMRKAFLWFYEKIKSNYLTGGALAGFIEGFVDRLFFTVIKVNDQLNAYRVFETLNARGVQLSSADLLKNHLFSVVDEKPSHPSELEVIEELWGGIIEKLKGHKFEEYLRYYWNSFNATVRKDYLFKTIKINIKTKEQSFALIRSLHETADLFISLQDHNDVFWNDYPPETRKYLEELKLFKIKQTNSLLITGFKYLDKNSFVKLLRMCTIISFRYNIISGLNPNDQESVYNRLSLDVYKTKQLNHSLLKEIYIEDDIFEANFSKKEFYPSSHKIVKYIFVNIENQLFGSNIDFHNDNLTVEHILPETYHEVWGDFGDEIFDRSVHKLGNLALLEMALNKEAGQKQYEDKKKIYLNSQCKTTSSLSAHYKSWNEDNIITRQNFLAKQAKSIWKINF